MADTGDSGVKCPLQEHFLEYALWTTGSLMCSGNNMFCDHTGLRNAPYLQTYSCWSSAVYVGVLKASSDTTVRNMNCKSVKTKNK